LFPYTPLFRSDVGSRVEIGAGAADEYEGRDLPLVAGFVDPDDQGAFGFFRRSRLAEPLDQWFQQGGHVGFPVPDVEVDTEVREVLLLRLEGHRPHVLPQRNVSGPALLELY